MMTVKLKDLVDFSNGYAFKSSDYVEHSNTVNCRMSNIRPDGSFDIEYNIKYLPDEFAEKYSGFILNDGDIIIAMTDMAGDPKILGVPTLVNTKGYSVLMNQRVGKLTLKSKDIHPTYLKYYLMSNYARNYFKSFAGGGVQLNIGQKEILNIDIKLCDMKEQVEICNVLDKINVLIQQNSKQIEKIDQLVKSRFIEMFGDTILNPYNWDKEPLGKVCDVRDGTHDSPKYYDTGYPLVTSKNLSSGDIDFTDCSLICKNDFDKINERSKVDFGDILMPMIGTVGNPVIVKIKDEFAIKNVALIKFCDNTKVTNIYIQALLKSDYFDSEVLGKVRGGTQKFISLGDIRKLEILVPPMELQNQFAEFVEQTDKLKFEVKQALEKLETLKKSLMQKYFG